MDRGRAQPRANPRDATAPRHAAVQSLPGAIRPAPPAPARASSPPSHSPNTAPAPQAARHASATGLIAPARTRTVLYAGSTHAAAPAPQARRAPPGFVPQQRCGLAESSPRGKGLPAQGRIRLIQPKENPDVSTV